MDDIDELALAIWDDDIRAVKRLLKQRPELLERKGPLDSTPLMDAVSCEERSVACVQMLLAIRVDVSFATNEGYTVLHCAVGVMGSSCRVKMPGRIVQMLVEAGAPLEERQHWGWTPLLRALLEGTGREVRALLEVGCNPNVFFPMHSLPEFIRGRSALAAAIADVSQTKMLLAHGADVHARDLHGATVLQYALQVLEQSRESPGFCREVMQSVRVLKKAMAPSTST